METTLFSMLNLRPRFPRHLPEGAKMRLNKGAINEIQYSPDGGRLAVAGGIGIWLCDTTTHQEIALLTGHTSNIDSISFSPDGHTLASGSWEEGSTSSPVSSVSFSPDGRTLASGSQDEIYLWDSVTGQHKRTFSGHTSEVSSVSFSPDGRTLASGGYQEIHLWDAVTGQHKRTLEEHTGWVRSVSFSPDGRTLASGSDDGTVLLWTLNPSAIVDAR